MAGKGRFDIDADFEETSDPAGQVPTETTGLGGTRLGPMAKAITEAGRSAESRSSVSAAAEKTSLELAVELKRLRKANLDLRQIPLESVDESYLKRDRGDIDREALDELKTSIAHKGLQVPIRVDALSDGRFGLNQGLRRLMAYRELRAETGDDKYAAIPAFVDQENERESAYRRMVDENLIREDVSMAELAHLAISYATEKSIPADEAVESLFASANRKRRWIVKEFVTVVTALGDTLQHPKAISHHLARGIVKKLQEEGGRLSLIGALEKSPERSETEEVSILESACKAPKGPAMGRVEKNAPPRKFRIKARRDARPFDVSVSDKRLIVSGKDIGRLSDDDIRDAIEGLIARLPFS